MAYKAKGGVSPLKQDTYWYKVNGKTTTKAGYLAAHKAGANTPGKMEGGGLQTNDPDVHGRKTKRAEARKKNNTPKKAAPSKNKTPLHFDFTKTADYSKEKTKNTIGAKIARAVTPENSLSGMVNAAIPVGKAVKGAKAIYNYFKGDKNNKKSA